MRNLLESVSMRCIVAVLNFVVMMVFAACCTENFVVQTVAIIVAGVGICVFMLTETMVGDEYEFIDDFGDDDDDGENS